MDRDLQYYADTLAHPSCGSGLIWADLGEHLTPRDRAWLAIVEASMNTGQGWVMSCAIASNSVPAEGT